MDVYKEFKKPGRRNSAIFLACLRLYPHIWKFLKNQKVKNVGSYNSDWGKIVEILPGNRIKVEFDHDEDWCIYSAL